ncbi:hypothetical protein Tco_0277371 [Tanacetum coccineum]
MKELKTRKEQLERENYDVVSDKKHLEEEPSVDVGECKKHRETPSNFRKKTGLRMTLNKKVDPEDRILKETSYWREIRDQQLASEPVRQIKERETD